MWIARDIDEALHLFASKPIRDVDRWIPYLNNLKIRLPEVYYPEVNWMDGPRELILE